MEKLLEEAARTGAEADARYGKGKRDNELPAGLARRESRLKKIAEAKAALEQEARERAVAKKAAVDARLEERSKQEEERGKRLCGRPPQLPDPEQAKPEPKAQHGIAATKTRNRRPATRFCGIVGQRNFTDPDSRITKAGASKSFLQGFHAPAAVDDTAQVIAGCAIAREVDDNRRLAPMIRQVEQNLGRKPEKAAADAGYFSVAAVSDPRVNGVEPWAPPDRQKQEATTEGAGEVIREPAKLAQGPASAEVSTDPAQRNRRRAGLLDFSGSIRRSGSSPNRRCRRAGRPACRRTSRSWRRWPRRSRGPTR
ncbi:MAG: hypothetical protein NT090_01265, partial [Acidobacteria bacterium]|nr:hypothetical protein [Acidobacteriota bacterium]